MGRISLAGDQCLAYRARRGNQIDADIRYLYVTDQQEGDAMLNFGVNYLAVLVAAIAGVVVNALWYTTVLKSQVTALRKGDATIAGRDPAPPMYAIAIAGQLV